MPARGRYKNPICDECGKPKPTNLRKLPECKACARLVRKLRYERRRYRRHGATLRRKNRESHWRHRDKRLAAMRERYRRNPEKERSRARRNYKRFKRKVLKRTNERRKLLQKVAPHVLREYNERYYRKHPYKRTASNAKRRAAIARATPPWAPMLEIEDIYALANLMTRILGRRYTVDHIVPLKHKLVCGLHVPANLQVISEKENQAKGNKWWPHMPSS